MLTVLHGWPPAARPFAFDHRPGHNGASRPAGTSGCGPGGGTNTQAGVGSMAETAVSLAASEQYFYSDDKGWFIFVYVTNGKVTSINH